MDRKWKSGAAVSPPALDNNSDGYATGGNPGTGTPATKPGAHWYHMVTEELLAFIAAAGVAFDKTVITQLRDAAVLLFDSQGIDPGGRLTLTTGVPVTTSDVSGATTIRYTPYKHDRVKLYDGNRWKWYTFTELSQTLADNTKSPAAAIANSNYDMFVWDDAGTLRCTRGRRWNEGAVAGSDTARGTGAGSTELEFFGGRWVNRFDITNGPLARRGLYVGTIRADGSSQANDTAARRHVWNTYNRVRRVLQATLEASANWTYTTATYRQANNNVLNQLDMVRGLNEDCVMAEVQAAVSNSNALNARVAIGLNSTTSFVPGCLSPFNNTGAGVVAHSTASWTGLPGLGRHVLTWIEISIATAGTTTWYGDAGSPGICGQSGINGSTFA
jgi:hypothetical protein